MVGSKYYAALFVFLIGCTSHEEPAERDMEGELVKEAQAAVRAELKDPGSAQFEGYLDIHPQAALVCMGKVNAKNAFGGYNGFENYNYSREKGVAFAATNFELWREINDDCIAASKAETAAINAAIKDIRKR